MKLQERCTRFLNNVRTTCEMSKWLNKQNKLCRSWEVINFCSCQLFHLKSSCQWKIRLNFLKSKIWILKTTLNGKITNRKVVGLEKLWNFVVDNVLVWIYLVMQNYVWVLNFEFLNYLEWKNHQNKSCKSWNVIKLCNWPFYLKSSYR
jgi:hypothetical protein